MAGLALRGPVRLLSDERLARRATSGDRRAFAEIFRRYHQDLYRFCLATASNPQDAQEALQNTMVKVMRALPGEQREIKLKPWLFRIARNEAVETMRKRRDTVELSADRIAAPSEITDATDARDRLRELFTDLAELPERQRSVLVMRELAGFEFGEIGETFGTSAAVARQTLYEARQNLRQMDEGREMACATVRQALSDADGRVTRRRDIRAHLRDCMGCRAFRDDIARRRTDFAAVAPLPAAISAGLLQGVLSGEASGAALAAGAGGATGGSIGGAVGMGAGKVVAGSALVKSAATVAVVAAVGAGAADRGGLIDLPRSGSGNGGAATSGAGADSASTAPGASGAADGASDARGAQQDDASAASDKGGGTRGEPASNGKGKSEARPPKQANGRPPHAGKPSHASQGRPATPGLPEAEGKARGAVPRPPKATPPADKGQPALPGEKASGGPPTDSPPPAPPGKSAVPPSSTPPPAADPPVSPPPSGKTAPAGPAPSAKGAAQSNKRPAAPAVDGISPDDGR